MEEHYVVVRTATNTEGGTASTATVRNTRLLAEQLYHEQLADAARQGRPCDAVTLLDMRGFVLKTEHYEVVPEPEPVEMCDVTFDAAGGYGVMQPMACVVGAEAVVPPCGFTREGYLFAGWNTEYDGTGDAFAEGEQFTVTGPLALKAQWERPAQDEHTDEGSEAGDDGSAA